MYRMPWRYILIVMFCLTGLSGCGVQGPTEGIPESPDQEASTGPEQPETPAVPPAKKWRVKVFGEVSSRPVLGSDGTIYVGTITGYVYAISPEGEVQWNADLSGWVEEIQSSRCHRGTRRSGRLPIPGRNRIV